MKIVLFSIILLGLFSCSKKYECDCSKLTFGDSENHSSADYAKACEGEWDNRSDARSTCSEVDLDVKSAD